MKITKKSLQSIIIIVIAILFWPCAVIGAIIAANLYDYIMYPPKAEIYQEFEKYNRTNNTVLVDSDFIFYFGDLDLSLCDFDCGERTDDWIIVNDKVYFSCYERKNDSQKSYRIFECDYNGENLKELYCFERQNTYNIDAYKNAFYISDGTNIHVFLPVENKLFTVDYKKDAKEYVKELKQQEMSRFDIENSGENKFILEDTVTAKQYTISDETMKNSEEGNSLLKFKHILFSSISDGRILITAHIFCKGKLDPYVIYEYDIENDKLIFQNYCEVEEGFNSINFYNY